MLTEIFFTMWRHQATMSWVIVGWVEQRTSLKLQILMTVFWLCEFLMKMTIFINLTWLKPIEDNIGFSSYACLVCAGQSVCTEVTGEMGVPGSGHWVQAAQCMMTSSNGNIFRVTGHLFGEFTGPWWIPSHKGQWRGALMYSLICVWINGWVNNREAGDLRCYRAHYDVTVMGNGNPAPQSWVLSMGHFWAC